MHVCDRNCPEDCQGDKEPTQKRARSAPKTDISWYLRPLRRPGADPTPLNHSCYCSTHNIQRSACLTCVRSWVYAVCKCVVEKEIEKYKPISVVTVDRLRMCLQERKQAERIQDDCCASDNCRDCCCKSSK